MIVIRLLIVALLITVAALGLAWLFTGNRKYLGIIGRVLRFGYRDAGQPLIYFRGRYGALAG